MWKDLKSELMRQYSTIPLDSLQYLWIVIPPNILPICTKALMSYLSCTCIMPVNFYQKYHTTDTSQIPAEGLNHYTVVYCLISTKLQDKVGEDPKVHTGKLWKTTSVISVLLVLAMKELRVTLELVLMSQ